MKCGYSYDTDTIEVGNTTDDGSQVPKEVTDAKLVGLVFKSMKPLDGRGGKHVQKEKPPILICCDFLESNKVAGVNNWNHPPWMV